MALSRHSLVPVSMHRIDVVSIVGEYQGYSTGTREAGCLVYIEEWSAPDLVGAYTLAYNGHKMCTFLVCAVYMRAQAKISACAARVVS